MAKRHKYNQRFSILTRKSDPVRDDNGQVDWTDADNFDTTFTGDCRLESQTSREFVQKSQQFNTLSQILVTRSCTETRAVDGRCRVTLNGRVLDVLGSYDKEERRDEVFILCGEVTA